MRRPWLAHYDPAVPKTIAFPDIPLHRLLERAARQYPENVATIFFGRKMTYWELNRQANRFAQALIGLGVRPGDRVALHLPNCPQFVIAYYGALKAGATVVPCSPLYVERELEHQLNDAGAGTIVTLSKFYPLVKRVQPATGVKHVMVTALKEQFPPTLRLLFTLFREQREGHRAKVERGDIAFSSFLRRGTPEAPEIKVKPDDLALLQYTGGTTGTPKGAMLTHRNLVSNIVQTASWDPAARQGRETVLPVLPFFHLYGMAMGLNLAIYLGGTMVLLPRFDLKELLHAIDRYRPTLLPGVPTLYVAMNHAPDVRRYHLNSIRLCLCGAAPLPAEVQTEFERLTGARLVEGYGLTEAGPLTHANPIHGERRPGTVGLPIPGTDAKIVDAERGEHDLPPGEIGEIVVRGPQVMRGYWNRPDETAHAIRDGWLYTGDIGAMDEDGYFRVVERKKDMIVVGGRKVYPREVEEVLHEHPQVKEAAVIGLPDAYQGEYPKAFVVLKDGEQATGADIIAFCQQHLARYKVPREVELRASLPKSAIGKVLRRKLQEDEGQTTKDESRVA